MSTFAGEPSSDDKLWSGISYLGLVLCCLPIVPLVVFFVKKEESAFIKFQSMQASFFSIAYLVISIGLGILGTLVAIMFAMMGDALGMVGGLVALILNLVQMVFGLGFLVYWIILTIKVFQGESPRIPVIADFVEDKIIPNC